MVQLEKPYRKERIPGLRTKVDKAVERSLNTFIEKNPNNYERLQKFRHIMTEYPNLTNEEVYDLCPFSTFLDTYPDRSDWTALYEFQGKMDQHMREEMKAWVRNIIEHLEQRLYPKKPGHLGY
jgi:hypothetical protein